MDDTICAICTAKGQGSIAIIRISGKDSIKIVNKLFKGTDLTKVESHTIHYGYIKDTKNKIIDEVLVSVMKAPKTYTTENVVEINTHGGIACTNKVLELLLSNGCRLAENGEFTKRAFLNGRIDKLEAEAVMDKITAQTEIQNELANNQLRGKVSELIDELRNDMVQIISNINVNIDYPEYDDVDIITNEILLPKIKKLKAKITNILEESKNGKIIKEGINTAIIGRPNAGKSSLLNALLEEDKAIVTDIAGTTRDIVEGNIIIDGIILNLIDTAGIRKTKNKIELIGVQKSFDIIKNADLILLVINNNEKINKETMEILEKIKNKNYLILLNKIDLENKIDLNKLPVDKSQVINMSLKNNIGLHELKNKIKEIFNFKKIINQNPTYLSNANNLAILNNCLKSINDIEKSIKTNQPIDMIEMDVKKIWEDLGKINGKTYDEELLDEMFSRFCLGK